MTLTYERSLNLFFLQMENTFEVSEIDNSFHSPYVVRKNPKTVLK